jgi:sulfite reductase (NADPH) hemoprotein beta-component
MYLYDELDRTLVTERVAEFSDQVARRLSGELTEEEFRPLRLMNGIYLQLHAYMLRIAIPYGTLSSAQMRMLAHVARRYDRNFGHFTTRQNIQFHWIKLEELPLAMADLASVGLHGMQTSGNCVRNITTDQWAGVAPDEIEDPRIWAEVLRQHLTMHPEFSFLPRKFKIALTAAAHDRAAVKVHDIGLRLHRNGTGESGFEVMVGGGLGRTPFIAKTIKPFLPKRDLLSYVEAILRVYNSYGRRDNIYKARIKILVHDLGAEAFAKEVEAEWRQIKDGPLALDPAVVDDIAARFRYPAYERLEDSPPALAAARSDSLFDAWLANSVANHKVDGYAIVTLSLKPEGGTPGDATAEQMDTIADLADRYSFGEIRVGHEQNLVLPHVAQHDCRGCGGRSTPAALPRPMLVWSPTSSVAPGSTIAAWRTPAPFRWRRRSAGGSATAISPVISARCTSTFPDASTLAAIITSAISAFSASRRTTKSSIRSPSAAAPTRRPRSAR